MNDKFDELLDKYNDVCSLMCTLNDALGFAFENNSDLSYLYTFSQIITKNANDLYCEFDEFSINNFMLNN